MPNNSELAILAGGCFWCTEAIFKRLKGVISVVPGYAGGDVENPTDRQVYSGNTGHVEVVQVEFDPNIIDFRKILDIFWHTHDPTSLNKQGYDEGPFYRSVIFYHNEKQKEVAEDSKLELEKSGKFDKAIVTDIQPFKNFYVAAVYHKDFYANYPEQLYCTFIIDPKIAKLLKDYSKYVKDEYK